MIAQHMVRLIEHHSEQLAKGLLEKLLTSEYTSDMRNVPKPELEQRVYEVYHNLREWLLTKTDADIDRWYSEIGARRCRQGVHLSHLVCALLLVKEHLWEFLRREVILNHPMDVFQELELFQLVDQFFDRAIFFSVRGYERAERMVAV
jgi:hypothetical protein